MALKGRELGKKPLSQLLRGLSSAALWRPHLELLQGLRSSGLRLPRPRVAWDWQLQLLQELPRWCLGRDVTAVWPLRFRVV